LNHAYKLHSPHLISDRIKVRLLKGCKSAQAGKIISTLRNDLGTDLIVVSNCASHVPNTETHSSIRGSNKLIGTNVAQVVFHKPPEEYEILQIVNQVFDLTNAVRLSHVDQINQTAGRNLGLRQVKDDPVEHYLLIGHSLWNKLEDTLLEYGRYGIDILETSKERKNKSYNANRILKGELEELKDDLEHIIEQYHYGLL
jgi:hypothetical protein